MSLGQALLRGSVAGAGISVRRTPGHGNCMKRRLQPDGLRERAADRLRGWRIVQCGILWRGESR
ncbi:MAG: hypothetical protein K2P38_08275 [Lachnospiraceae bacterium]|nr:hypothetical protein [Lachnospiraceae bacterium]